MWLRVWMNVERPERGRELRLDEECGGALSDGAVSSLCNAVLMRLVCLCVLAMDAVLGAESNVLLAHVLAALVVARRLDAQAQAVLHVGFV